MTRALAHTLLPRAAAQPEWRPTAAMFDGTSSLWHVIRTSHRIYRRPQPGVEREAPRPARRVGASFGAAKNARRRAHRSGARLATASRRGRNTRRWRGAARPRQARAPSHSSRRRTPRPPRALSGAVRSVNRCRRPPPARAGARPGARARTGGAARVHSAVVSSRPRQSAGPLRGRRSGSWDWLRGKGGGAVPCWRMARAAAASAGPGPRGRPLAALAAARARAAGTRGAGIGVARVARSGSEESGERHAQTVKLESSRSTQRGSAERAHGARKRETPRGRPRDTAPEEAAWLAKAYLYLSEGRGRELDCQKPLAWRGGRRARARRPSAPGARARPPGKAGLCLRRGAERGAGFVKIRAGSLRAGKLGKRAAAKARPRAAAASLWVPGVGISRFRTSLSAAAGAAGGRAGRAERMRQRGRRGRALCGGLLPVGPRRPGPSGPAGAGRGARSQGTERRAPGGTGVTRNVTRRRRAAGVTRHRPRGPAGPPPSCAARGGRPPQSCARPGPTATPSRRRPCGARKAAGAAAVAARSHEAWDPGLFRAGHCAARRGRLLTPDSPARRGLARGKPSRRERNKPPHLPPQTSLRRSSPTCTHSDALTPSCCTAASKMMGDGFSAPTSAGREVYAARGAGARGWGAERGASRRPRRRPGARPRPRPKPAGRRPCERARGRRPPHLQRRRLRRTGRPRPARPAPAAAACQSWSTPRASRPRASASPAPRPRLARAATRAPLSSKSRRPQTPSRSGRRRRPRTPKRPTRRGARRGGRRRRTAGCWPPRACCRR